MMLRSVANTCIDRAAIEVTLIRKGTKLDNLVQVAHNCQIGGKLHDPYRRLVFPAAAKLATM